MSVIRGAEETYRVLIEGWNRRDAEMFASAVADDGLVIGFDGSEMLGRAEVARALAEIFADHDVARYVTKIRSVTEVAPETAVLHAVAGMVPSGGDRLIEGRNAVQTVVVSRSGAGWSAVLFQNTPARFDGRPEVHEALTAELSALL